MRALELQRLMRLNSETKSISNKEKILQLKSEVQICRRENKVLREDIKSRSQNLNAYAGTVCNTIAEFFRMHDNKETEQEVTELISTKTLPLKEDDIEKGKKGARRSARFEESKDDSSNTKKRKSEDSCPIVNYEK